MTQYSHVKLGKKRNRCVFKLFLRSDTYGAFPEIEVTQRSNQEKDRLIINKGLRYLARVPRTKN